MSLQRFWTLALEMPQRSVFTAEQAFQDVGAAFSSFEKKPDLSCATFDARIDMVSPDSLMVLEVLLRQPLAEEDILTRLALLKTVTGLEDIPHVLNSVPETNWLRAVYDSLPTVRCDRFFLYGSHHAPPPLNRSSLRLHVDAATAFGSGHHETTFGCLRMLLKLSKHWCPPRASRNIVLDIGCGTGVLAMAALRLWPFLSAPLPCGRTAVLATDIDPEAVTVTRQNLRQNALSAYVSAQRATGLRGRPFLRAPKASLILANILASPLLKLAPDMAQRLKSGGYMILAGLLNHQALRILARYRGHGLYLQEKIIQGDWTILLLRKRIRRLYKEKSTS